MVFPPTSPSPPIFPSPPTSPSPPSVDNPLPYSNLTCPESDICQFDGNASILSVNSKSENESQIPVYISNHRKPVQPPREMRKPVRKTIKRNNLVLQSINLPVIMNINPRSIYNKSDEFSLLLEQYSADIICMSESWERHLYNFCN